MRDEKRQTRLLPFRLRRAGDAAAPAGRRDPAEDPSADAELSAVLRTWEAPAPSEFARARLLADFRAAKARVPLWRRAMTAGVRVPLPAAACALVALGVSMYALAARTPNAAPTPHASAAAPVVQYVEVPVVQERVVTRVVYVDKKERRRAAGVLARADAETGGGARRPEAAPPGGGAQANYYTRVDMADFKPADEMKIRIVNRGKSDEK